MSEWLNRAFSGGVSLARVNPFGIVLMVMAVAISFAADPVSRRCCEERRQSMVNRMKVASLLLVCIGAAVAMF